MALRDPETTERSNLVGARVVLEAARDRGAPVIFGGSFRVYGDDVTGQTIDESLPYGRVGDLSHLSKVYVEQLARMIGGAFVSVRLGVTYGLSPIMKTAPQFMTVPNLFCQRAVSGEVLQVHEDRPMAFIHVDDAADALVHATDCVGAGWHVVNAAPEVATIGQVARTVQRLVQARGGWVRIQGAASSEATFTVRSQLDATGFRAQRTLVDGLPDVLDYFSRAMTTVLVTGASGLIGRHAVDHLRATGHAVRTFQRSAPREPSIDYVARRRADRHRALCRGRERLPRRRPPGRAR